MLAPPDSLTGSILNPYPTPEPAASFMHEGSLLGHVGEIDADDRIKYPGTEAV
jgi:hypothetical protein